MTVSPGTYRIKRADNNENLNNVQEWIVEKDEEGVNIKNPQDNNYLHAGKGEDNVQVTLHRVPTKWQVKEEKKGSGVYNIYFINKNVVVTVEGHKLELCQYNRNSDKQDWKFERVEGGGGGYGGGNQARGGGYGQEQQGGGYGQSQQGGGYGQPQDQGYGGGGGRPAYANSPNPEGGSYTGALRPGRYTIHNVLVGGKAIDLSGNKVSHYGNNNGENQKWQLIPGQNGYQIKSGNSYLGYQDGNCNEGTIVAGSNTPVEYTIQQSGGGYQISPASNPNLVLDLAGNDRQREDGATICLWSNKDADNQRWTFQAC